MSHKTRVERVGVGYAACWMARCTCGWEQRGSSSTRVTARDFALAHVWRSAPARSLQARVQATRSEPL